ncbi:hypothetical protein [Roseimaritima ulvae]|uniref:Uncharacterized protein n=1 Tax=Roseimaritima ulvae TaxID=980254 RepID=A0A5B9QK48_9BACT|nr:hypothetical protein [Roseimaritima ulvae]QEG39487.1 hypothetical protein UC8_14820 [Roseimaritima ulvae]
MFRKCFSGSVCLVLTIACSGPALAQRGQFIEGLFRSIVEAELEKNQQREQQRRQQTQRTERRPLPSAPQPPDVRPAAPSAAAPRRGAATNDQRLLTFRDWIQQYTLHAAALADELRRPSGHVPGSRALIGDVLHLHAHADALSRQALAVTEYRQVIDEYCDVDSDWRPLSFQLRSLDGLRPQTMQSVSALDQYSNQICKLLGVQAQFDRRRMQELMTIASTYMNALLDDLQLVRGRSAEIRQWIHDGRILEQQLQREADFAATAELDQIMPRYNDFVTRWRSYAAPLYQLNDAHVDVRLERIRQCGEEVFALMYMPPVADGNLLFRASARLEQQVAKLLDQLTIRALVRLPAREQNAIVNDARSLWTRCREFNQLVDPQATPPRQSSLRQQFVDIDGRWQALQSRLAAIDAIDPAVLRDVQRSSQQIRELLGMHETLDQQRGLELAASLEGQAEYLNADIQRYRRYYTPRDFGAEFTECGDRFLRLARQLNSQLSNQAPLRDLQATCKALLSEWEHLSESSETLSQHGLSGSRPYRIQASMRELAPIVAELAAMLID